LFLVGVIFSLLLVGVIFLDVFLTLYSSLTADFSRVGVLGSPTCAKKWYCFVELLILIDSSGF
jgi:hypothetical protein